MIATFNEVQHYLQAGESYSIEWRGLTSLDPVGDPVQFSEFADRSVHIVGVIGGGSSRLIVEGSNELVSPTNWFVCTGSNGIALSLSGSGVGSIILEPSIWIRVRVLNPTGATNVSVFMFVRRIRLKQ